MTCFRIIFIILKKLLPILLLSFFLFSIIYFKNHWLHDVQFYTQACLLFITADDFLENLAQNILLQFIYTWVFVCFFRIDTSVQVLIYVVLSFFTKRKKQKKTKFKMDLSALILLIFFFIIIVS